MKRGGKKKNGNGSGRHEKTPLDRLTETVEKGFELVERQFEHFGKQFEILGAEVQRLGTEMAALKVDVRNDIAAAEHRLGTRFDNQIAQMNWQFGERFGSLEKRVSDLEKP